MLGFQWYLIIFSFFSFCFGGVADHFKKAKEKDTGHSMRNIDFIYMINLDERPEKWHKSAIQLAEYGIYPYRFSAVNGWNLSLEAINDLGLKFASDMDPKGIMGTKYPLDKNFKAIHEKIGKVGEIYFCHCTARGTIGIQLSHLSVLQDAYDSGYQTIWVMEDDIEVVSDPRQIPDLIKELDRIVGKDNWDILATDRDIRDQWGNDVPSAGMAVVPNFHPINLRQYFIKRDISNNLRQVGSRFGATSLVYRRSGLKKILDFVKSYKIFLPYDMVNYLPSGIKFYTVKKNVVTNLAKSLSDNGGANYLKKQATK